MIAELLFTITSYSVGCDVRAGSRTASGVMPVAGFTAAADLTVLPMGTIVYIEGFGKRMVQDVGSSVKGLRLDLYVSKCSDAKTRKNVRVRILHRGGERG